MTQSTAIHGEKVSLLRVLGPGHVWALGVGIVLVGEYMGWNFAVGKGGALAALIACWVAGLLYTCVAMIDSEVTSTVAAAGGQYAQAKHIVGPLMAFNVGLFLVLYRVLTSADVSWADALPGALVAGIGWTALLALGGWLGFYWWRKRDFPATKWFLRAVALSGIGAVVAMEAGWIVTEVGRQPWIVQGLMRTEDAVTNAGGLWFVLVGAIFLYAGLGAIAVVSLRRIASRQEPGGDVGAGLPYGPPAEEPGR